MGARQLQKDISEQLKSLSEDRLQAAYHFIAYLNEHEENAATAELLNIKGFHSLLERAERDADEGNTVPLAEMRRDV